MERERLFDLETRIEGYDPFDSIEKCREYDRDSRTSMIIPMQHMMQLLEPYCRPGATFLEVGCAAGLMSLRLAGKHPEVDFYGIEQNDHFLPAIQENLIMANLVNYRGKFSYEWARYSKIPIEDNTVDVVFSFSSLHRWPNPLRAIRECSRVCKKDGIVLLYDLTRDAEDGMISFVLQYSGTGHEQFMGAMQSSFTKQEMVGLLSEAGLSHWQATSEVINLIVSSKAMDTSYSVGEQSIYEHIFQ